MMSEGGEINRSEREKARRGQWERNGELEKKYKVRERRWRALAMGLGGGGGGGGGAVERESE